MHQDTTYSHVRGFTTRMWDFALYAGELAGSPLEREMRFPIQTMTFQFEWLAQVASIFSVYCSSSTGQHRI